MSVMAWPAKSDSVGPGSGTDTSKTACSEEHFLQKETEGKKGRFDLGLESGRKLEARRIRAWIEEPLGSTDRVDVVLA